MTRNTAYSPDAPDRTSLERSQGELLLEFGTDWCGHCQAAQAGIAQALSQHPALAHLKIEDGKGRPLGRSYGVKLWPTLILLRDGQEVARCVRPVETADITRLLQV
jgi:thioredoxin 1